MLYELFAYATLAVVTWYVCNLSDWALHTLSHIPTKLPFLQDLHRTHMAHHKIAYPVNSLLKDPPYHGFGGEFAFAPLVMGIWFIIYLIVPLQYAIWCIVQSILFAYVSDYLHTHYHIRETWMEKYAWFRERRKRHFYHHHHLRMNMSLGGIDPVFDRLFGTYHTALDKEYK